jgi:hypothetical protein
MWPFSVFTFLGLAVLGLLRYQGTAEVQMRVATLRVEDE